MRDGNDPAKRRPARVGRRTGAKWREVFGSPRVAGITSGAALLACMAAALGTAGCRQTTAAAPSNGDSPVPVIASAAPTTRIDEGTNQTAGNSPSSSAVLVADEERADLERLGFFGGVDCPGPDLGDELIGTGVSDWQLSDWVNSAPLSLPSLRGRVVVVRFWLAPGCPFCEKSMPALQQLATEFRDRPITFVGAFHSKPANATTDMSGPAAIARDWGITFPLAFDREWKTLRSWWLTPGRHRHATSVTFVLDQQGKVAFVHPGPAFYPNSDPEHAQQDRDFRQLRKAIKTLLAGT